MVFRTGSKNPLRVHVENWKFPSQHYNTRGVHKTDQCSNVRRVYFTKEMRSPNNRQFIAALAKLHELVPGVTFYSVLESLARIDKIVLDYVDGFANRVLRICTEEP